jgi:hypothetical protein
MVKEDWISRRSNYLSQEGKKFARWFLLAAIATLCLATIVMSICLFILATVMAVSSVLARVISFVAAYFVKAIATFLWPKSFKAPPDNVIYLDQDSSPLVSYTPLPGVPRFVLQN